MLCQSRISAKLFFSTVIAQDFLCRPQKAEKLFPEKSFVLIATMKKKSHVQFMMTRKKEKHSAIIKTLRKFTSSDWCWHSFLRFSCSRLASICAVEPPSDADESKLTEESNPSARTVFNCFRLSLRKFIVFSCPARCRKFLSSASLTFFRFTCTAVLLLNRINYFFKKIQLLKFVNIRTDFSDWTKKTGLNLNFWQLNFIIIIINFSLLMQIDRF